MTELGKKVWGDPVKQAAVLSRIPIGRCAGKKLLDVQRSAILWAGNTGYRVQVLK
jgi:hypothetical protein